MNSKTMLATVVAAISVASLAGVFWLGELPETSAETQTEPTVIDAVPVADGDRQINTPESTISPTSVASSFARERDASVTGSSPYRSLAPEVLTPVQQATGTLCETSSGNCTVSPQPIGSPCRCGEGDAAMIGEITR